MNQTGKLAVAVAGGYVLGRRRKTKLAIALAMWMAGKKLSLDPSRLRGMLGGSGLLGGLNDQVRGELVTAGKNAATTALTRRAEGLSDALHQRSELLRGGSDADTDDRQDDDADAEPDGDERDAENVDDGDERDAEPAPRRRASRGGDSDGDGRAPRVKRAAASATKSRAGAAPKRDAEGGGEKRARTTAPRKAPARGRGSRPAAHGSKREEG